MRVKSSRLKKYSWPIIFWSKVDIMQLSITQYSKFKLCVAKQCCSGLEPGFCVKSVFDLSCLISLFS